MYGRITSDWRDIVKVGITKVRYVTLKNVRPWAVHSYKNTRGRGTGVQPTKGIDGIAENDPTPDTTDSRFTDAGPSGDVSFFLTSGESWKKDEKSDQSTQREDKPSQRTELRSSSVKPESSYPKPVSTYEKVRLILMPWKKPEGLLNKPVFKMMIESLMLYVMTFSGANLNNICEKYSPYLQTFSVRELLDVLEELDCVGKIVFRKPKKASLFSTPAGTQNAVEEHYEDDNIFYEATPDCVVKLGQFIEQL